MIRKLLTRTASTALLTSGILLTTAIAGGLIAVSLAGPKPVFDAVSCQLGFSEDCLLQELNREKQNLRKLRERTAELEALHKRLSKLDHASSSYAVFYHDEKGKHTVSTGIEYESLVKPEALKSGWCYIQLKGGGPLSRNLHIAEMNAKLKVTKKRVSKKQLKELNLKQSDIDNALLRCKWPETAGGAS